MRQTAERRMSCSVGETAMSDFRLGISMFVEMYLLMKLGLLDALSRCAYGLRD